MLLACWGASKWFQSKPVIQFCVICMANVVGKCCLSATPGRCWYTSVVWGTWHNFCPAPAGGVTHPQVCHCCKWGLRKRSFSLLPVTEILPPGIWWILIFLICRHCWCTKREVLAHPADRDKSCFHGGFTKAVLGTVNKSTRWFSQERCCLRWWEKKIASSLPKQTDRETQVL